MIKNIAIGKVVLERTPFMPPVLLPLVDAAAAGDPLEPALNTICAHLGFDSFMFGMSTCAQVDHDSQIYTFTTLPAEWVARYDKRDYIEVDPRVRRVQVSRIPILWDFASERGHDQATDSFLEDAAAHGIGSGFAVELINKGYFRGLMALNSTSRILNAARRESISRNLGTILLLGGYFHDIFCRGVIEQGAPPVSRNAPLSVRQLQCLELAARGLTTDDIALKLKISSRTAQFHFDCIRTKLGAANRQEAVAIGLRAGVIALG